jgi:hypothetical protein
LDAANVVEGSRAIGDRRGDGGLSARRTRECL